MSDRKATTSTASGYHLAEHPWTALAAFILVFIAVQPLLAVLASDVLGLSPTSPPAGAATSIAAHILTLFVVVPFGLRLPKGKRSLRQYLADIRLSLVRPNARLLLLGLFCFAVVAVCQTTGMMIARLQRGLPVNWVSALAGVLDPWRNLPPRSWSLLISLPSLFEEVAFRGVVLRLFLGHQGERRAIVVQAAAFGLMHLFNLGGGHEASFVAGQVVWSFLFGLFYGHLAIRAGSLLPAMIVHYLSNVFVASLTAYMAQAGPGVALSCGALAAPWMGCLRFLSPGLLLAAV